VVISKILKKFLAFRLYHAFSSRFEITLEELEDGEDIANCPSCTLKVRVIYEPEVLEKYQSTVLLSEVAVGIES
jgi:ATP-dependent RNA circularization protein (DNA/RNA ligase family)